MESSHDSIKYIEPRYTNAQRNDFDWDLVAEPGAWNMDNRFDDPSHRNDIMYESFESRYATELVNVPAENIDLVDGKIQVKFMGGALDNYIFGSSVVYVVADDKIRKACAMQVPAQSSADQPAGRLGDWMCGADVYVDNGVYAKVVKVDEVNAVAKVELQFKNDVNGEYKAGTITKVEGGYKIAVDGAETGVVDFKAVGRFNSEKDLTGKYLGEVEITMRDYHFRPRPISLGVTWTQLTELVLDTSFGISTEEILLDYASQEIKKALDYQSIQYASNVQKTKASDNFVQFDAEAGGPTKDSYWHTAQLIGQAIGRVEDNMLNKFGRGGVTAIVGGTDACRYLELNEGWSVKGAQPKIGAHKVGELNGKIWNAVVKVA